MVFVNSVKDGIPSSTMWAEKEEWGHLCFASGGQTEKTFNI